MLLLLSTLKSIIFIRNAVNNIEKRSFHICACIRQKLNDDDNQTIDWSCCCSFVFSNDNDRIVDARETLLLLDPELIGKILVSLEKLENADAG